MDKERLYKLMPKIELMESPTDIAKVELIEDTAFSGHGEDIYTLAMIAKVGWLLGATSAYDGKLLGAIELLPSKSPGEAFVHGVCINPDVQSVGVGDMLIRNAVETAREAGMQKVCATIATTNGASLNSFINKNGFTATRFYWNFYGVGEHRLWVEKDLSKDQKKFQETDWHAVWLSQTTPGQHQIVEEDNYELLDTHINEKQYQVIGIMQPIYTGYVKNLLYLEKRGN